MPVAISTATPAKCKTPTATSKVVVIRVISSLQRARQRKGSHSLQSGRLFAMATDFSKLRKSEFWMKKMDRFVRVQDTDKSGDISRADFDLILERYKKLGNSNPKHLEMYSKHHDDVLCRLNLPDESVRLSYDEFKEKLIEDLTAGGRFEPLLEAMFHNLDINGDGVISFEEWTAHYQCMGIDPAHARASFDAMDQNSDGKISMEEFVNFHYEYYYTAENKLGSAVLYGPLE